MASFISDLKSRFHRGDINVQLIYINVGVFVVTTLVSVFLRLFYIGGASWMNFMTLPASIPEFLKQPWSLLSYMFLHADPLHLLFNMLWLYLFGQLFLSFFSARHFRGLYLLGGICGGLFYMLALNVFPYFTPYIYIHFIGGFCFRFGNCGSDCCTRAGISGKLYVYRYGKVEVCSTFHGRDRFVVRYIG